MFLRANARAAGLVDVGAPRQATYAASEGGGIRAVAAHAWNGMVLVQAPVDLDAVVRLAVAATGRAVTGLSGPWDQVCTARAVLGLTEVPAALDSREDLFVLPLEELAVPPALAAGAVRCRLPRSDEIARLVEWRIAYAREALGAADGPALHAESRRGVERAQVEQSHWVLEAAGELVAYSMFNARLPDMVQVGGVYAPPALRGRGYAHAVVAGSLRAARDQGVRAAVLFTSATNEAARRAYQALGFRIVGEYGLILFAGPGERPRSGVA